jgi:hypothetical protein
VDILLTAKGLAAATCKVATMLGRVKRWVLAMLTRKNGLRVSLRPPRRHGAFDPTSASWPC